MIETLRRSTLFAIVVGGLVAGTLDIGAAALINLASPLLILKFVAGGLMGKTALAGGHEVELLGLALQWAMSLIIAAIYVFVSRRLSVLRRHWVASGLAYGVAVFFVMNYIVVPLSAWAKAPSFTVEKFAENMLAMMVFGLIVAYVARYRATDSGASSA